MQAMKFFIDTHDRRSHTFPEDISAQQFSDFFAKFEMACREEGVVLLRAHVGLDAGRAYCFNMAPSIEHIRRAHDKVGLPFETITEVCTATPGDLFFQPRV